MLTTSAQFKIFAGFVLKLSFIWLSEKSRDSFIEFILKQIADKSLKGKIIA